MDYHILKSHINELKVGNSSKSTGCQGAEVIEEGSRHPAFLLFSLSLKS